MESEINILNYHHLHIIIFNVPYPADYGGVIDVFYRIKALSECGVKIHLHCFQYGRKQTEVLNELCESVHYYERPRSVKYQFSRLPFIVNTRKDKQLLNDLLEDSYPILFEGLHCCYYLNHPKLKDRLKIVRSHNIEHNYYRGLASKANTLKERFYFTLEAFRLQKFENVYTHANHILAISVADKTYFQQKYGKTLLLPPNHPGQEILSKKGRGKFILYHGDISTQENCEAVLFILNEIVPHVEAQFVFAGKNPSSEIQNEISKRVNCKIVANPSYGKMQLLVMDAHINLLPTFQATGFKLKLLNALFNGRFCVGTPELVAGTGVEDYCEIASSSVDLVRIIRDKMDVSFSEKDIEKRKALLQTHSNSAHISEIIELL